ncbi:MAG: glucarate dehydratase [Anaerolineaceae bacterium]|nr:glucarate dehydratase [Anaerolineaceae bacterium]
MKITDIHITPIAIADPPLLNAAGLHAPFALRIIVELVTDSGLSGWGEVPGSEGTRQALEQFRDHVVGKDPFQLNAIFAALTESATGEARGTAPWDQRQTVHVQSAIEVACYDLMGKAIGRPVVDLLGGKARDRVPFAAYLFYKYEGAGGDFGLGLDESATGWPAARQQAALDAEGIVAQAKAMVDHYGFKSIKLKGGVFEPAVEVESMIALQEAFGKDVPLRLDPNALWKVDTAIEYGKKLEGVLEYYEDPVRGQENMAAVAKAVDIPLATNMCTTSFADLPGSVQWQSEAIILSDHHFWGGFRASLELARFCRTFGRGLSMHSNSHLGISLAAMVHMAAAVPNLTYDLDTHYPWQDGDIEIVSNPLQFVDGTIAVSDAPGLGVEIDREKLAELHEKYIACGLTERNDEIEMQKVQPGWTFQPTRW